MTGCLVLIVGPSGAGKDTLIDGVREALRHDPKFVFAQREITRPHTAGGEDHEEVSVEMFETRRENSGYMLWWGAHELFYGISSKYLKNLDDGQTVILNGSRGVLDEARSKFSNVSVISVTVGREQLRERLKARGRETAAQIEERLKRNDEMSVSGADVITIENNSTVENGISKMLAAIRP